MKKSIYVVALLDKNKELSNDPDKEIPTRSYINVTAKFMNEELQNLRNEFPDKNLMCCEVAEDQKFRYLMGVQNEGYEI